MRRKGISPLIAAVLLIAFTMAVASLFAQWAPQLMQDAQADTADQAQDISDYSDIVLELDVDTEDDIITVQQISGSQAAEEVQVTGFDGSDTDQVEVTLDDGTRDIETVDIDQDGDEDDMQLEDVDTVTAEPIDKPGAPTAEWEE